MFAVGKARDSSHKISLSKVTEPVFNQRLGPIKSTQLLLTGFVELQNRHQGNCRCRKSIFSVKRTEYELYNSIYLNMIPLHVHESDQQDVDTDQKSLCR